MATAPYSSALANAALLRCEIRATATLGWSLIGANLATSIMSATDLIFLGRLSPDDLAAGTLALAVYLPVLLFGVGTVGTASAVVARAIGNDPGDRSSVRNTAQQALLLSLLLALPAWLLLWNAPLLLAILGEPVRMSARAAEYTHGLQWALLPNLGFFALRSVLSALGRAGPVLWAGTLTIAFNVLANWLLVFGHLGFPALGIFGSGLATTTAQACMLALLLATSQGESHLADYRLLSKPWAVDRHVLRHLWSMGAPAGTIVALEIAVFAVVGLLMGRLGATALVAHSIAYQVTSLGFMIPLGIGQAATVRVGYGFGRNDLNAIFRSAWASFLLAMALMTIVALTMLIWPRLIISAFVDVRKLENIRIIADATAFIRIAAVFQMFNAAQAVGAGVLRGLQDTNVPLFLAAVGYWLVGLPLGAALAFGTPLAGAGLWIGLTIGFAVVSVLLIRRWCKNT